MTALSAAERLKQLSEELNELLQSQKSVHRVRNIHVIPNCTALIIKGNADSFYAKQTAQEIARKFLDNRATIQNHIQVGKEEATKTSDSNPL
jgi:hypothetical protein